MTADRQSLKGRIRRARAAARRRGFTLIEMMVSLAAGLLISAAAFLMARNASRFFQSESGITSAQFQLVVGMTRMQADLRRASFMTTPNVDVDSRLCGGTSGWPAGMLEMTGIHIQENGSAVRHPADHNLSVYNGLTPDALIVGGVFGTTEQFAVQAIQDGGGGLTVYLQEDGAMWRTRDKVAQGGPALTDIFRPGRYLRVIDTEGRFGYGIITGVNPANPNPQITLSGTPSLPTRSSTGVCGCEGFCTGAIANPVVRMLYDLRTLDLSTYPQYEGLYARSGHAESSYHRGPAEPSRTELVRVELDQNGDEIPLSLEVLAEYAVDLKFGITRDTALAGQPPNLVREPIGDNAVYTTAALLAGGGTPETIRGVQIRFSTRASRRDRERGLNPIGTDAGLLRFGLGADLGFVRMRTLLSDVQLPNQQRSIL